MYTCVSCGKEFDPMGLYLDVCHDCNSKYYDSIQGDKIMPESKIPFFHHMELYITDDKYYHFRYYLGDMRELNSLLDQEFPGWQQVDYTDVDSGNSGTKFNNSRR